MKTVYDIAVKLELNQIPHECLKVDRTIYIPDTKDCKIIVKETDMPSIFRVEYLDNWKINLRYDDVVPHILDIFKLRKKETPTTDTQEKIALILDSMKDLLLYKNQKYGDSAINPKKIFYKGDSTNSILIRLDDKLSRILNSEEEKPRINDCCDLIGYLTLLLISLDVSKEDIEKLKD
jgi:hypothetical protein